jgi:hypothetical protein
MLNLLVLNLPEGRLISVSTRYKYVIVRRLEAIAKRQRGIFFSFPRPKGWKKSFRIKYKKCF